MKILLDEKLPHQLRKEIPGHDVYTVAYLGWAGTRNGLLLAKAAQEGFDLLISNDHGIQHEQNLNELPLAVVILNTRSSTIEEIRTFLPTLMQLLTKLQPRTLSVVAQIGNQK